MAKNVFLLGDFLTMLLDLATIKAGVTNQKEKWLAELFTAKRNQRRSDIEKENMGNEVTQGRAL